MARKHKPEEIIGKLREAEIVLTPVGPMTVPIGGGLVEAQSGAPSAVVL